MKVFYAKSKRLGIFLLLFSIQLLLTSAESKKEIKTLEVLATAYNSLPEQTDETPFEAAWGDMLSPETKSIAVSRDLLQMGLTQYSKVEIDGLPGEYVVLDKMNSRWEKKIDIYMGTDIEEALEWGVKKVTIKWKAEQ
jgi:3D (Asp-Asp-Asp) domain-containing protein